MKLLLDTNVLSELHKTHPDSNVESWWSSVQDRALYTSVLVIAEIRKGIERLRPRDPRQAQRFEFWLMQVIDEYEERILPVTLEVAEEWGRSNYANPLPAADGLIAATARIHGMCVVTRNVANFSRGGVRVLNPFELLG
ncbi:MAG: type II toxin-antitoxin system VapC family toxin [Candidatus Dormibacteraceae bacterium]